jgi:AraC-like DNA-binding protein
MAFREGLSCCNRRPHLLHLYNTFVYDGRVPVTLSTGAALVLSVFSDVPHVMVCVKDHHGKYIGANAAFVDRTSKRTMREVLGKRAGDLFAGHLARSYEAQDRSVLLTEVAVRNQLEVITDRRRQPGWYLTTKVLDRNDRNEVQIIVVSSVAAFSKRGSAQGGNLRRAVDYAHAHFDEPLRVTDLARIAKLSTDQFERATRSVLGVSPKQFVLRLRIDAAATQLVSTDDPLGDIAVTCGFYDQPQFTRQFKTATGLTPGAYRDLLHT